MKLSANCGIDTGLGEEEGTDVLGSPVGAGAVRGVGMVRPTPRPRLLLPGMYTG